MPNFSLANIIAGTIFSSIGFIGFFYGRRMNLLKPVLIGIALMAYPYFIENTLVIYAIGIVGTLALFVWRD
ncbi:MAG: hypothetical protein H0X40_19005 [Chthoniobacterales bacterium]|nr:hypothetical protein [Chthoniobacterales bacterium]